jgi:hypothetical protein
MGKLVELLFVEHLEGRGERIVALEAVERTGPDIVTERDGKRRSFEVKYLGRDDDGFTAIVESLKSGPKVQCGDLKGSINYVVFRVYEAAKQLRATPADGRKVAFVIDDQTLHTVELQLRREWIKWSEAKLYDDAGQKAKDFLETSRKDYPDLDKELAAVIRELEGITFVRLVDGFRFEPMFDAKLR